jgi:hypothetical protein
LGEIIDNQDEGLIAKGRSKSRNCGSSKSKFRSKSRHRNLVCYYYHKKGHIKSECFKLKNKDKHKEKSIDAAEASVVTDENEENIFLVIDNRTRFENEWILDLGCSYHMCPVGICFPLMKLITVELL